MGLRLGLGLRLRLGLRMHRRCIHNLFHWSCSHQRYRCWQWHGNLFYCHNYLGCCCRQ